MSAGFDFDDYRARIRELVWDMAESVDRDGPRIGYTLGRLVGAIRVARLTPGVILDGERWDVWERAPKGADAN